MKHFCILATILVAVTGNVHSFKIHSDSEETNNLKYPEWYVQHHRELQRQRRDRYSTKFGYEHHLYDGDRGSVDGRLYGSHSHNPPRPDSTSFGAGATWTNDHAHASVDYGHQMHGRESVSGSAGYSWPIAGGTLSVDATADKTSGRNPDYGGKLNLKIPIN